MPTQFFTHQISKTSGLILHCCCFKTHSHTFAGGYAKWYTYMRKKLAFLHKHLLLNLAIKYTSNNIKMHMHSIYCSITCSQKVLEATLISKHRQLNKLQYIHAKAYCAAARKNEKCLSQVTWSDFQEIGSCLKSRVHRSMYRMLSFINKRN